jgi:branched-chain amino acid transport system ATP-binding protein
MLKVEGLACGYNGRALLTSVDFEVGDGEMLAVLGPNGAGKTTMLSTLVGLLPTLGGRVTVDGADVTATTAVRRARDHRVAWVPEGRRLFNGMSVLENLALGCYRAKADARQRTIDDVLRVFPMLGALRHRDVATLSGGEQQMVAIGRALAMRPRVLLLDEPSLGLAPLVVDAIFDSLVDRLADLAVVLVEQNVEVGLHHATHAVVLEGGSVALRGSAAELRADAAVQRTYFAGAPT